MGQTAAAAASPSVPRTLRTPRQACLYGGTCTLVDEVLPSMGIQVTTLQERPVAQPTQAQPDRTNWDAQVQANTKVRHCARPAAQCVLRSGHASPSSSPGPALGLPSGCCPAA